MNVREQQEKCFTFKNISFQNFTILRFYAGKFEFNDIESDLTTCSIVIRN